MKINNKSLAEFVGILLGDGSINIYKGINHQRIKITLDSEVDKDYSIYISNLIFSLFNIRPILKNRKSENALDIFIFKRDIIRFLVGDVGLKSSPKYDRACIPDAFLKEDYANLVLRGYFDTDGSVVITNNNGIEYPRLEMKICKSPMQKQFIDILKKGDFRFGCYHLSKGALRIQMNGKNELYKWIRLVGSSNRKHIDKIKIFIK